MSRCNRVSFLFCWIAALVTAVRAQGQTQYMSGRTVGAVSVQAPVFANPVGLTHFSVSEPSAVFLWSNKCRASGLTVQIASPEPDSAWSCALRRNYGDTDLDCQTKPGAGVCHSTTHNHAQLHPDDLVALRCQLVEGQSAGTVIFWYWQCDT